MANGGFIDNDYFVCIINPLVELERSLYNFAQYGDPTIISSF